MAEIFNCGEETARSFMLAFIRGVSNEMYSAYVYVPEGEELDSVKEENRRAGLPGYVGSMDCTPVLWDRAAKKIANQCRQSAWLCENSVLRGCCRPLSENSTNDKRVMQNDTYPYDLVHNRRVHGEQEFRTYYTLG